MIQTYDAHIQHGNAMDMAGTWVLYIKSEVLDMIQDDIAYFEVFGYHRS